MSTKVIKRTPDLGIGIKLQPLGEVVVAPAAQAAPSACDVDGVYWASAFDAGYRADAPDFYSWTSGPTVNNFISDVEIGPYSQFGDTYEVWRMRRMAARMDTRYGFIGVPFGPACGGVMWSWTWDIPDMPPKPPEEPEYVDEGQIGAWTVQQVGSVLIVELFPGVAPAYPPYEWNATLTATARCGDTEVGQLVLVVGTDGY